MNFIDCQTSICITSPSFKFFSPFYHVHRVSSLSSYLIFILSHFILVFDLILLFYYSLSFISFLTHFASLFTYSFCFDSLLLIITLCFPLCPLISFYALSLPFMPFYALLFLFYALLCPFIYYPLLFPSQSPRSVSGDDGVRQGRRR